MILCKNTRSFFKVSTNYVAFVAFTTFSVKHNPTNTVFFCQNFCSPLLLLAYSSLF
nr:MAG TPA: hypothetical protein [Caudoviricetes sp.]